MKTWTVKNRLGETIEKNITDIDVWLTTQTHYHYDVVVVYRFEAIRELIVI